VVVPHQVALQPAPRLMLLQLAELPLVAVAAAGVVAVDVAAVELPGQSPCIARSSSFRCGSEFQDRTPLLREGAAKRQVRGTN